MIDILIELDTDFEFDYFTPKSPAGEAFCKEQLRIWPGKGSTYNVPKLGSTWVIKAIDAK